MNTPKQRLKAFLSIKKQLKKIEDLNIEVGKHYDNLFAVIDKIEDVENILPNTLEILEYSSDIVVDGLGVTDGISEEVDENISEVEAEIKLKEQKSGKPKTTGKRKRKKKQG